MMRSDHLKSLIVNAGKTYDEIAREMDVPTATIRSWVRRLRFPPEELERFAKVVGSSSTDLRKVGVDLVRPSRNQQTKRVENLMPLIKAIASTGVECITPDQIRKLRNAEFDLGCKLSSAAIAEMLKLM